jgi:PRD1 phage membrane DNA delivery
MNALVEAATTIALAIVGLAIISVLVSRNAQTPQVIQASASGFANSLGVAESPVTGSNPQFSLGYPSASSFGMTFGS